MRRFRHHGITIGGVELDLPVMMARKDKIVRELTDGVRFLFKKNRIEPVFGTARLASPTSVQVARNDGGERTLEAEHILLATGSVPIELPFLKFDGKTVVGSTEALCFERVPEHLVVVGGGYIGLELGSVWKRLGSRVSVIEFLPRIVPMADTEIGTMLHKSLIKQGLEFHLEMKVTGAEVQDAGRATVKAETKDGKALAFDCDKVLVSVGRKASISGLGLDEVGVRYDPKTHKVATDDTLPHERANHLGHRRRDRRSDARPQGRGRGGRFRRTARRQGGAPELRDDPERHLHLARDGQRRDHRGTGQGAWDRYRIGKYPFQPNGRAKAMGESEGVVKVLADAKTDRVLGVHILGPRPPT